MKLDVFIVEDTKVDAKILTVILESYFEEKHISYSIQTYDTGLAFYSDFEEGYINPSMVFMDIFLPKSNGLELCKKMREKGFNGDILITSETKDHSIDAFSVDARAYICKPYNATEIFNVLQRVCQYSSIRTYTFKIRQRIYNVPVADVCYVESNAKRCTLHCRGSITYTIYKKLDEIADELSDAHFIRCHKSYYVNMDCVTELNADGFTMLCGDTVPIKQADIKYVKETYANFCKKYR